MKSIFLLLLATGLLCGCASQSSAPDLVERYLVLSAQSGDENNPQQHFAQVLTGSALDGAVAAAIYMQQAGLTQQGVATAQFGEVSEEAIEFCLDVSPTKLIDADGLDVTASDRVLRLPMLATLESNFGRLAISELVISDEGTC